LDWHLSLAGFFSPSLSFGALHRSGYVNDPQAHSGTFLSGENVEDKCPKSFFSYSLLPVSVFG
jgi:hypothetical protein